MHSTESRPVIGPSNILFAGVYVCTFQPGNITGWGSEGVNKALEWFSLLSIIMQDARSHIPLYSLPLPKLSGISVLAGIASETTRR